MNVLADKEVYMEHFYKNVPGNFTFPQFYSWLASQLPKDVPTRGVEIGVLNGQSAAYLGVELINNNVQCTLDLVDIAPREWFYDNLKPIHHILGEVYNNTLSWEGANKYEDKSLDFVFIDADHTYESVSKDISAWLPKVKPGGIIAGHDFSNQYPGIIQAVIDHFEKWEVWRGTHWDRAPQLAPHQKDWYWPVWWVRIKE